MKTHSLPLPFSDTGYFSELIVRYLTNDPTLAHLYSLPFELSSFKQIIEQKRVENTDRKTLVEVFKEQYETYLSRDSLAIKNIEILSDINTFTVTTGHQLCLFTGPLYFIYKIISTINLAEKLKQAYPENNFVPVYWMASEDHDFEEINHINLFGKKIEWKNDNAASDNVPSGKIVTDTLEKILKELRSVLGNSKEANNLYNLLCKAYLEHSNMASATRYLVNELFGKFGLVIIDSNDKRMKQLFTSVIKNDMLHREAYKHVAATAENFVKQGIKPQVNPREINFFYISNNTRERIEKDGMNYRVLNTSLSFSEEELMKEIENHPERFSPNVVLRPLYQETVLPNIAYVGGAGELGYWLEYKSMFDHYQTAFPILVLRNSVLWIDENNGRKLDKLGIKEEDIFKDTDTLVKTYLTQQESVSLLTEETKTLENIYTEIAGKAGNIDPTLQAFVESEMKKQIQALENIESKMLKALKRKHETSLNQLKGVKEKLFPDNGLQERYDNFIPYYLKYGQDFIITLKDQLDPLDKKFRIIRSEA